MKGEIHRETPGGGSFEHVYARFAAIWSDSRPMADEIMLRAALAAHDLSPGEVTDAWLQSLNPEWVYLESERPFEEPALDTKYRQFIAR